jgi:hypothetical protein
MFNYFTSSGRESSILKVAAGGVPDMARAKKRK